jgi:hypothetical protein
MLTTGARAGPQALHATDATRAARWCRRLADEMGRAMRILKLTLASADLRAQSAFWGGMLELPVRSDGHDALEVRLRSSVIRFERASPGTDPRYHFAINIPPCSIEQAAAWITERHSLLAFHGDADEEEGATIVSTDRGASTLYFLDGVGNVAELISSPHIAGALEQPFGADSLFEVAEIGIATTDVHGTGLVLQETFGAGILWGGREGSRLTAIGDDHGVVIVAPIGRGWIPVGLAARPLPTSIVGVGPSAGEVTLPEGPFHLRAVASQAADGARS